MGKSSENEYLEGRHAVMEALEADIPILKILIAEGAKDDGVIVRIVALAAKAGIPVQTVRRSVLDGLSTVHGAHQGVMAQAQPYTYATLQDLIAKAEGKSEALIIALDHVQDPGNLGAIARSAEIVGACGVLIPNRRAAQITPLAHKASAGAVSHIPIAREANMASCLESLKSAGFWVIGADGDAPDDIWQASLEGRIVLVMGSEGSGLSRLVRETCDSLVALPQAGHIGSLNVAQATTAIVYEWMRRNRGGDQ